MHNQHAGLTGVLSEQRMTERHQEAAHERVMRSTLRRCADVSGRPPLVAARLAAR